MPQQIARVGCMIVILMGVCGVGKTTIGRLLAARTGWKFEDADDYHSEENRRKMAAGVPLTDADRGPWLRALHERMLQYKQKGENAVFACSALKQQYRSLLAGRFVPSEIRFVCLHAPAALIRERMKSRHHPYMNPDLLDSQAGRTGSAAQRVVRQCCRNSGRGGRRDPFPDTRNGSRHRRCATIMTAQVLIQQRQLEPAARPSEQGSLR